MPLRKLSVTKLVLDYELLPRSEVDSQHVNALREAILAGESLPPIVADSESKVVIDGFHRVLASRKIDVEMQVEVDLRQYASDADRYAEAVQLNARHGRRLTPFDHRKIAVRCEELGIPVERLGSLLGVSVKSLERKSLVGLTIVRGRSTPVPLKRTLAHLDGKELTPRQVQANDQAGGMSALFFARQLISLIENDALDLSNAPLLADLERLAVLIAGLERQEVAS